MSELHMLYFANFFYTIFCFSTKVDYLCGHFVKSEYSCQPRLNFRLYKILSFDVINTNRNVPSCN